MGSVLANFTSFLLSPSFSSNSTFILERQVWSLWATRATSKVALSAGSSKQGNTYPQLDFHHWSRPNNWTSSRTYSSGVNWSQLRACNVFLGTTIICIWWSVKSYRHWFHVRLSWVRIDLDVPTPLSSRIDSNFSDKVAVEPFGISFSKSIFKHCFFSSSLQLCQSLLVESIRTDSLASQRRLVIFPALQNGFPNLDIDNIESNGFRSLKYIKVNAHTTFSPASIEVRLQS